MNLDLNPLPTKKGQCQCIATGGALPARSSVCRDGAYSAINILCCVVEIQRPVWGWIERRKRAPGDAQWHNACRYHFHWKCDGGTSMQRQDLTGAVLLLTARSDRVRKKEKQRTSKKNTTSALPARALRYGQGCARNHLRGRSHANNAATSIESRCRRIRRKRREQKREYWSEKKVRRPGFTQSPYQLKSTSMSNSTTYPGPGPLPKQT